MTIMLIVVGEEGGETEIGSLGVLWEGRVNDISFFPVI
jgi:hypothetical protein